LSERFTVLHLGCGRVGRDVNIAADRIITLDRDPLVEPDLVCDLGVDPIPLGTDTIDLAIAIHVLEHIGRQGETKEWFRFWEELYRVLKPGARLQFESPLWSSVWCWGDPSHTRAISEQAFAFFNQDAYRIPGSPISPYRIRCDFQPASMEALPDWTLREPVSNLRGVLVTRKPLRPWWEDGAETIGAVDKQTDTSA
jgi:SAM-dependent methyltransferase